MEQIVKRKREPFIKIVLLILFLVIIVNFTMAFLKLFTKNMPYITTIAIIFLITISCWYILTKYLSDFSYNIIGDILVISRIIGKRKFNLIELNIDDIESVEEYNEEEKIKYNYSGEDEKLYLIKYKKNNKINSCILSPNEEILKYIIKNKNYKK